jgi:hypothetical protein
MGKMANLNLSARLKSNQNNTRSATLHFNWTALTGKKYSGYCKSRRNQIKTCHFRPLPNEFFQTSGQIHQVDLDCY